MIPNYPPVPEQWNDELHSQLTEDKIWVRVLNARKYNMQIILNDVGGDIEESKRNIEDFYTQFK